MLGREAWSQFARGLAIDPADIEGPVATEAILSRLLARTRGLPPVWQVRAILATTVPWTIEDGSLTPTLKVNPPHATILVVGAGEERAVARHGKIEAATMMTCTLSTDHRAVDGALGAELMAAFKRLIENPVMMVV